jgi:hypothetical protein
MSNKTLIAILQIMLLVALALLIAGLAAAIVVGLSR